MELEVLVIKSEQCFQIGERSDKRARERISRGPGLFEGNSSRSSFPVNTPHDITAHIHGLT